ncbi:MAG TPA: glycoside hydrolase family 3 N-terminal domain-containing protein [Bacteroidia bacterium]|jgi:beta-N-acetylhexosaminidase|nr:glycoside hydrolase family 3 N-terminal domain-containing protein [Bacteroidia bacterium]
MRVFCFKTIATAVLMIFGVSAFSQILPPFQNPQCEHWADSVIKTLSPDERIGQLFMVAAYSDTSIKHKDDKEKLAKLINEQKIGGLIFFKGTPCKQAELCNYYQSLSNVPMLIGMDAEWGLAMRLDSVPRFPFQMALGATHDTNLIFNMGAEIAQECKRLGVQVDFAPVVDINDNPDNPVIGMRSFGEEKTHVTEMGLAYMQGLQSENVLACAKHFPGHGDTKTDSHLSLPVVDYPISRLDTLEFYPFEKVFNSGMGSTMVAHLYIPALDSTPNRASTLSPKIVDSLLKKKLGFQGLIFTDALNMQGVAKYYPPGVVDVKALLAGNDVLLFSENVPKAIEEIKKAMEKGEITQEEIDARCRKLLMVKAWTGLNHYKPVALPNLTKELNSVNADYINRLLAENTITVLSNKNNLLPLKRLDTLRIASLVIGDTVPNEFQTRLGFYAPLDNYNMRLHCPDSVMNSMYQKLKVYNLVIIGVTHTNTHPQDTFGISRVAIKMIDTLEKKSAVILDLFSDPYIIPYLPQANNANALILSYQNTSYMLDYSAQLIFGGIGGKGNLSVSASPDFKRGAGIQTPKTRLEYTMPEEVGISSANIAKIDTIANYGIKQNAYPGCIVLAAKDGKVFYEKTFGTRNYKDTAKVKPNDIYDLASVTKVAATTMALMKLTDEKKVDPENNLASILPEAANSGMKSVLIKDILTHQAGLKPDILFYKETMTGNQYRKGMYNTAMSDQYPYPVASHLFIRKDYKDTILNEILHSPVDKKQGYKYSDLGMLLMGFAIKDITGKSLDIYLHDNFYRPMGLQTMMFNPINKVIVLRVIPTEYDSIFRKQLLWGTVHDPSAAILGGVAGNAGLFSDASDLASLMQMLLQNGTYGGERYIDSSTVSEYTSCMYCDKGNRRGLGFDKPEIDKAKENPTSRSASQESYGHSGFTGTYVWVDPKYGIVYVFLSNRVASGSADNKLAKLNIRTDIQQVIYNAIGVK